MTFIERTAPIALLIGEEIKRWEEKPTLSGSTQYRVFPALKKEECKIVFLKQIWWIEPFSYEGRMIEESLLSFEEGINLLRSKA
jgi:hypothetical protein